ncbi:MAG: tetratricopeptide repeat protein [Melioribacteraceae bacterium]|nr:tetratricopeptide repeat protein [Melioribacteraceae bacterium]MCF8265366.1 tetratricopeptide repeat protein [Melioribacteraceae bacterium]
MNKIKFFNIATIYFFILLTISAQPKLDSLLNSMDGLKPSEKINTLTELCWEFRSRNPRKAINFGLEAIKLMDQGELSDYKSETFNFLGVIHGNLGNLDTAFHYYNRAMNIARDIQDSLQIAYSLNNIGDHYFKNALYSLALQNIMEANEIFEFIGDERGIAYTLNDIGEIYLKQMDYPKAMDYFVRSGELRLKNDDSRGYAKSLINQAAAQMHLGEDSLALFTYNDALKYCHISDYVKGESWVLAGMGDVYFSRGKFDLALEKRLESLEIDQSIENKYGELINCNQIGAIYLAKNNIENAEKYLLRAMNESESTGHLDQLMISQDLLREAALRKKEYKSAYNYLEYYELLKDSIYSQDNSNKIADLQTTFIAEKKERENDLLKKDIEFQKTTRNYLYIIVGIIGVGIFLLVIRFRHEKRINQKLYDANNRLNELNAQKDKLLSIIGHDLKNPAGSIRSFLQTLNEDFDEMEIEETKECLKYSYEASTKLIELLNELLEWGSLNRGLVEIEESNFDLNEVITGIKNLLNPIAKEKQIEIITEFCEQNIYSDKNMMNTVLRNLISNALKFTHSGGKIIIRCESTKNENLISIIDNGVGIKKESFEDIFRIDKSTSTKGTNDETGTGLGLPICKEFVERCGGKLKLKSELGIGSQFTIQLPKQSKLT